MNYPQNPNDLQHQISELQQMIQQQLQAINIQVPQIYIPQNQPSLNAQVPQSFLPSPYPSPPSMNCNSVINFLQQCPSQNPQILENFKHFAITNARIQDLARRRIPNTTNFNQIQKDDELDENLK